MISNKTISNPRGLSHAPLYVRLLNPLISILLRMGFPMGPMILLTVRGRKTGQPRTTPVGMFEVDGRRYLLSTFGKVNWVYNVRAAGEVILTRGFSRKKYAVVELSPGDAAPVYKGVFAPYLTSFWMRPMVSSWYGVTLDTSPNELVNMALKHPAFELQESHSV
jgi:deazaflavin-dependent oxidoreductase (nitroreductase family)